MFTASGARCACEVSARKWLHERAMSVCAGSATQSLRYLLPAKRQPCRAAGHDDHHDEGDRGAARGRITNVAARDADGWGGEFRSAIDCTRSWPRRVAVRSSSLPDRAAWRWHIAAMLREARSTTVIVANTNLRAGDAAPFRCVTDKSLISKANDDVTQMTQDSGPILRGRSRKRGRHCAGAGIG